MRHRATLVSRFERIMRLRAAQRLVIKVVFLVLAGLLKSITTTLSILFAPRRYYYYYCRHCAHRYILYWLLLVDENPLLCILSSIESICLHLIGWICLVMMNDYDDDGYKHKDRQVDLLIRNTKIKRSRVLEMMPRWVRTLQVKKVRS